MQPGHIFGWAPAVAAFAALGTLFYNLANGHKSNLREEFIFAKEFLEYRANAEYIHLFILEKGFFAIAGDNSLPVEDIEFILTLEEPSKNLHFFKLAKKYLIITHAGQEKRIEYVDYCKGMYNRIWRKILYLSWYVITFLLLLSPLIIGNHTKVPAEKILIGLLITIPVFGFYAYLSIREFARLAQAEKLVNNQKIKSLIPSNFNSA